MWGRGWDVQPHGTLVRIQLLLCTQLGSVDPPTPRAAASFQLGQRLFGIPVPYLWQRDPKLLDIAPQNA